MRIDPDTKDALLFITGLLGMVSQGFLAATGLRSPSLGLCGSYLAMCGIAAGSSMLGNGRRDDEGGDNGDVPAGKAPRQKAKPRRKIGQSDGS